jgi:hypothetical protein
MTPDRRLPALSVLARARVYDMRRDADELRILARLIQAPLPTLPFDPVKREQTLVKALLVKHETGKRLLALLFP